MKRLVVASLGLLVGGCPKDNPAAPDAGGAASASASASASSAHVMPSASASAAAPKGAPATYQGKYTAAPATYYLPTDNKEFKHVQQAKDDPSKMVGDGTVTLAVDANGTVTGTIDSGPASPAIVAGEVTGSTIAGTIRRKDPADLGLTGALHATIEGDTVTGTMKLADANAALVREAKFTAKKK